MALVHIEDKSNAPEPLSGLYLPGTDGVNDYKISTDSLKQNLAAGLLSDPNALAADEFDDDSIHSDWVLTQPSSGTITANEGNHKLSLSCTACTDFGLFARPLSSFGGAWSDGVTVLEAEWSIGRGITSTVRSNFCVTNGTSLGSSAAQINMSTAGGATGTPLLYQFLGTPSSPYGVTYQDCGTWSERIRARILSVASGSFSIQVSVNGKNWVSIGTTISLGFTPTHVGFIFGANNGVNLFSSDYVRRIA